MNLKRHRVASQSLCILLCTILITPGCISLGPCKKGNCVDGHGVYSDGKGEVYTGEFKAGKYHGNGEMRWTQGRYGDMEVAFSGTATGTWRAGDLYDGTMITTAPNYMTKRIENGKITQSSEELAGGHRYESTYANGAYSQKLIYSNGQRYVGQIQVGRTYQPHGTGTMFFPNGTRYEGEWKDGYPVPNRGTSYAADGVPIKTPKDTSPEQFLSLLLGGAVILGGLALLLGGGSSSGTQAQTPAHQGPSFENDWQQKCRVYAGTTTCASGSEPGSLE